MASILNIDKRNVFPNWRSFRDTAKLGETGLRFFDRNNIVLFPIDQYVFSWEQYHTIASAGDLLSAALMNGNTTDIRVQDAANFIVSHKQEATPQLVQTAERILNKVGNPNTSIPESSREKLWYTINQSDALIREIKILKAQIDVYPYNPVAYMELALKYVKLGNEKKAREMVNIALRMAPDQRFIIRSAARFFLHIHDNDQAHYVIRHALGLKKDPWMLASEIAISSSLGKTSENIKIGQRYLVDKNIAPFNLSELGCAIGTVEMEYGSRRKALQAFEMAREDPNDNGLAQLIWAAKYYNEELLLNKKSISISSPFEANAMNLFSDDKYSACFDASIDWLYDIPYSQRVIQFASSLAYTYLKDYESAIQILKYGLKMNPQDEILLNNLAYASALSGDISEAEIALDRLYPLVLSNDATDSLNVCYLATMGLKEYRCKRIEDGRKLYEAAINLALKIDPSKKLAGLATLNFIREELINNPHYDISILDHLDDIHCNDVKEEMQIKKDIINLLNDKNDVHL